MGLSAVPVGRRGAVVSALRGARFRSGFDNLRCSRCQMLLDRLFFLAVRQVSKPVAAIVRGAALESDILKGFLSSMGQGVHRLRIWATRRAEGKTATHVTPLAADRAVEGGADLLSEFVIYSVAAVTIAWQYDSDQRKKDKKEADEKAKEVQRIAEAQKNEKAQWDRINEFGRRITLMQEEVRQCTQHARFLCV